MVRFLHTSDWQLGMSRRFLPPEAQHRFADARVAAIERIGALVRSEGCSFVVVCGDVFESNHVSGQLVSRALDALAQVPVPVYLLPGNHDPFDAASIYRGADFQRHRPPNVHVLTESRPLQAAPDVWLMPAVWLSKRPAENPCVAALDALASQAPQPGTRRVLLAHGALDTFSPHSDDPTRLARDALLAAVAAGHVDYVALGDRHSTTAVDERRCIWYSGSPEATDFDEQDVGNVLVVSLPDGNGAPTVTAKPIGRWQFLAREWPLDGDADIAALADWLDSLPNKRETVLKLRCVGTLTIRQRAYLEERLAIFADRFAAIVDWETQPDLVERSDEDDFAALGLSGFAAAALAELQNLAQGDGVEARKARRALALLWRLAQPVEEAG